jgi:hypothetical protein
MKHPTVSRVPLLALGLALAAVSRADVVELKDGTRIEGIILNETQKSLEIQIGANPAGTIRRVLVIDASEIKSWLADAEGRVSKDAGEVLRLEGNAYVDRLIREAELKVGEKDFTAAIRQFQEAAEIAGRDVGVADTEDKVRALELRAHAYRLLAATLDGKIEMLESRIDAGADGYRDERRALEKEWEDLQGEIEDSKKRLEGPRKAELGSRHFPTDLQKREDDLRLRIHDLKVREQNLAQQTSLYEVERIKTEAEKRLAEERVDEAESVAKKARAALGKRR